MHRHTLVGSSGSFFSSASSLIAAENGSSSDGRVWLVHGNAEVRASDHATDMARGTMMALTPANSRRPPKCDLN